MALQPDGHYSATISLPVGAYVQYKYTLGDGFWNAEHKSTGEFVLRELIVPAQDTSIQDTVETWHAGASSPILFQATVPSTTPVSDIVYIQFNPYGWTEPIPMWPLGNNQWAYQLYSPLDMLGAFHYRYCRNGQCDSADDYRPRRAHTPLVMKFQQVSRRRIFKIRSAHGNGLHPTILPWLARKLRLAQPDSSAASSFNRTIVRTGLIIIRKRCKLYKAWERIGFS